MKYFTLFIYVFTFTVANAVFLDFYMSDTHESNGGILEFHVPDSSVRDEMTGFLFKFHIFAKRSNCVLFYGEDIDQTNFIHIYMRDQEIQIRLFHMNEDGVTASAYHCEQSTSKINLNTWIEGEITFDKVGGEGLIVLIKLKEGTSQCDIGKQSAWINIGFWEHVFLGGLPESSFAFAIATAEGKTFDFFDGYIGYASFSSYMMTWKTSKTHKLTFVSGADLEPVGGPFFVKGYFGNVRNYNGSMCGFQSCDSDEVCVVNMTEPTASANCLSCPHFCKSGDICLKHMDWDGCTCARLEISGNESPCAIFPDTMCSEYCKNGALCYDNGTALTCVCKGHFTGPRCEWQDACRSNPCGAQRHCEEIESGYKCVCHAGFTGQQCELCFDGFSGDNCDQTIDECVSAPCGVHEACTDGVNEYICSCLDGFTGERCSQNIDDCLSMPCGIHGKCMDGLNEYTCSCFDGFTGIICDYKIDACTSVSCGENSTCLDAGNDYNCTCDGNCMVDVCDSSPCDRGTCTTARDGYTCTCLVGYEGDNCSQSINGALIVPCEDTDACNMTSTTNCSCFPLPEFGGLSCAEIHRMATGNPCFTSEGTCTLATDKNRLHTCACVENNTCDLAPVQFACVSNHCDDPKALKNTKKRVGYKLLCQESCGDYITKLVETEWTLTKADHSVVPLEEPDILKYTDGLFLLPRVLEPNENYILKAQIAHGEFIIWESAVTFSTTPTLTIGTCFLSPATGFSIQTEFTIECPGWAEAIKTSNITVDFYQLQPGGVPLKLATVSSAEVAHLSVTTHLFVGERDDGFQAKISYTLTDDFLQTVTASLPPVIVRPPDNQTFLTDYVDSVFSTESLLSITELNLLLGIMSCSTTMFNKEMQERLINKVFVDLLRTEFVTRHELNDGLNTASVLLDIFESAPLQKLSVLGEKVMDMAENFSRTTDMTDHEEISSSLITLTASISQLMDVYKTSQQGIIPLNISDVSTVISGNTNAITFMDDYIQLTSENLNIFDDDITVNGSQMAVYISKNPSNQLLSNPIIATLHGSVDLQVNDTSLLTNSDDCFTFKASFYTNNPYWTTGEANQDSSGAVKVDVQECSQPSIKKKRVVNIIAKTIAKRYVIDMIAMKPQLEEHETLVNETLNSVNQMAIHDLKLTHEGPVVISVSPLSEPTMEMFLGFNFKPSPNNYSRKYVISDELFEVQISNKERKAEGIHTVSLGIKKICSEDKQLACSNQIVYKYVIGSMVCSTKSDVKSPWTLDNKCRVVENTPIAMKVQPGSFASFRTSLLIPPDTLHFQKVWRDVDDPSKYYEVLATVVSAVLVYVVGLVVLRREDQRDHIKWRTTVLADNQENEDVLYEVHVHTGSESVPVELCIVEINICGELGELGFRSLLREGAEVNYFRDNTVSFLITSPRKLGDLKEVNLIVYKSSGEKVRWFLNFIVVVDMETLAWNPFIHRAWIEHEGDPDRQNPVTVIPVYTGDFKKVRSAKRNIRNLFLNTHNWISSFYRTVKTTFTRVQRWTCCIFALFVLMLCSALWFKASFTSNSFGSDELNAIITSLYGSAIATASTSLLAVAFAKTKISNKESEMNYMTFAPVPQLRKYAVLPHYMVYITHLIAVSTIVASGIVCIFYSIDWGLDMSRVWLITFFFGLILNVFIFEPLEIFVACAFITYKMNLDTDFNMYRNIFS